MSLTPPDCDYVDGEVRERNVGEYDHGRLQARLAIWFGIHERDWHIRVIVEQRIRVSSRRYRIPDVCVIDWNQPIEQVFTAPPLICIEVLSKDDSLRSIRERVDEYLNFGVPMCGFSIQSCAKRTYARKRVSGTGGRDTASGGFHDSRTAWRNLRGIGLINTDAIVLCLKRLSFQQRRRGMMAQSRLQCAIIIQGSLSHLCILQNSRGELLT